jgi:MFS family permease
MSDIENPTTNNTTAQDNTVVISVQTWLDGYRLRNFYITNSFQGFVWMIFHFSVIFFFTFLLENIALVGIFLWFANLIAFFLDIPLWIIQRYIHTKRLFIIAAISQLIAVGIFFGFIFKVFGLLEWVGWEISPESTKASIDWFFWSALNWIWVFVASICYGLTKELNDVSTYGYVLSHANPSEYGTILARNNITFWVWSLLGLLLSWVLLNFSPHFAVIVLGIIITLFLMFTIRYFDNDMDSVSLKDIENFKVSVQRWNAENVKEYIVETVKKTDIEKVIQGAKYLMIKPKQKTEEKVPWKEIFSSSRKEFKIIWDIFSHKPGYKNLIWTITLVLTFWFWDTFASSFLLNFLDEVKAGWSFVLLAIIWVPWIVLQEQASKLWQKIGIKTIGIIGLMLSGSSLILMWAFALLDIMSPSIIIGVALINSLGYACGMSTGQNQFLDIYNKIYAEHEKLTEINTNASSGPMKVVQNLANVIGLVFGGILVGFGFPAFFFIFWSTILVILYMTMTHKDEIHI